MLKLFNDDCTNVLKKLEDRSVNLIITDPPYDVDVNHDGGKLYANKGITKSNKDLVNLNIYTGYNIEEIGTEVKRIMKHINAYFWCNKKQIPDYFKFYVNQLGCSFEVICWHKTNALPTFNGKYLTDTEYCLYFFEKGYKLCNPNSYDNAKTYYIAPINSSDKKLYKHPTIKPLDIEERFILNSSTEGDIVLDMFMGSGTTGVAAIKNNRSFIGVEINKDYYGIAKQRIENTNSIQLTMNI